MKTVTLVLDTSFLLALVNSHDLQHENVKQQLLAISADILHFEIPLVCVIEALIKNPYPREMIGLLRELLDRRDFELTLKDDLDFIAGLPLKVRSKLKANDCSVIAISKRLNAGLLTLDKDLSRCCNLL
jgi:predicted nucleic acid-binding protein